MPTSAVERINRLATVLAQNGDTQQATADDGATLTSQLTNQEIDMVKEKIIEELEASRSGNDRYALLEQISQPGGVVHYILNLKELHAPEESYRRTVQDFDRWFALVTELVESEHGDRYHVEPPYIAARYSPPAAAWTILAQQALSPEAVRRNDEMTLGERDGRQKWHYFHKDSRYNIDPRKR